MVPHAVASHRHTFNHHMVSWAHLWERVCRRISLQRDQPRVATLPRAARSVAQSIHLVSLLQHHPPGEAYNAMDMRLVVQAGPPLRPTPRP